MRVGVIGPVAPDYFADNVGDAISRIGCEVSYLGPARPHGRTQLLTKLQTIARDARPQLDANAQNRVVERAIEQECNVIVNLDARLSPDAVGRLRREGMTVAFWFPDAVSNLGRQLMLLAPYNALFFKDPHIVATLRSMLDIPVYYLPQACNPRWHRPIGDQGTERYLVIAGNMYPSRVRTVERLMSKGVPIKLYGTGFPRWLGDTPARGVHTNRAIFREEKAKIFRSALAVLNTMHPAEVMGVNSRLFEAAGCGAAVLTEYRPTVPDLFVPGQEVLVYRNFDELIDHANQLLEEPGVAANLGNAASTRAHQQHTYDHRVAEVLKKLQ